jgi:hypothetical protein
MSKNNQPDGLVMQDGANPFYGQVISKGDESLGLPDLVDLRTHITTGTVCPDLAVTLRRLSRQCSSCTRP